MLDFRQFRALPGIVLLSDIIRRWWRTELAFADERGYVVDHADGTIIPPHNDFCRLALFSRDGFRRCNDSVREVGERFVQQRDRRAIVHRCHLGFLVAAYPVDVAERREGFVFVGGFIDSTPAVAARRELLDAMHAMTGRGAELDASVDLVPRLREDEVTQLCDLLQCAAREVEAHARLLAEGAEGDELDLLERRRAQATVGGRLREVLESVEREMILQGLIRTHWNKSRLARELGISRSNLILKVEKYGLWPGPEDAP